MADLLTVDELKEFLGIQPSDTRKDAQYETLIPAVTRLILNYTERDFASPLIVETRVFEYDGSGYLDIDDANTVSSVSYSVPSLPDIAIENWTAHPLRSDDHPVYTYLMLPTLGYWGVSPEMGFERNFDVLAAEGRWPTGATANVNVTAQWGWPDVPEDVKLAASWTVKDWTTSPPSEGVTAESIADYSRSYGRAGGDMIGLALPARVRDILAGYAKFRV
jgi:hypothetical protein